MIEPLNAIERRLVEAARDPARRAELLNALPGAVLYVSPLGPPEESQGLGAVYGVRLSSGQEAAGLFTAPQRVSEALADGAPLLAGAGHALLKWLAPGPLALNPGLVPDLLITREEVAALLNRPPPPAADVLVGRPANTPVELVNRLNIELDPLTEVAEAFLAVTWRPGEAGSAWLLGVRSVGLWSAVQAAVDKAVQGYDFDRPLQLVDLEKSDLADVLRLEIAVVKPRKPHGFVNLMRR
ncbi:hypothetical protein QO010_002870 [Caulobacter ginsengisoli]|uniref:SseB protein N-terminal domain-containing protein n=1 Tax=Caulobacter ginsengisoli TaxID=400775 RepID=A0ABU0ISU8_9CAUL|nr:enhanced serine sensitivity protein SseB C-terminal domain-containing protein [Caulobacter ginsengisoli]MDQ0465086.1 hypothetical protein [Caulobacter ginsengisoli]